MRRMLMTALCLLATPALAADGSPLRGQWTMHLPTDPTLTGTVLIDAAGRVTLDAVWSREARVKAGSRAPGTGKASSRGYAIDRTPHAELVLTTGVDVARMHCTRQNVVVLHCYTFMANGEPSAVTVLTRIGQGPESLMPAPR